MSDFDSRRQDQIANEKIEQFFELLRRGPQYGFLGADFKVTECDRQTFFDNQEEIESRRIIGVYKRSKKVRVSTVFLGFDHKDPFSPHMPLWFETMIFGGPYDGYQQRYETYEQALEGHFEAVQKVKESNLETVALFFSILCCSWSFSLARIFAKIR